MLSICLHNWVDFIECLRTVVAINENKIDVWVPTFQGSGFGGFDGRYGDSWFAGLATRKNIAEAS
jgi:hypothetical protein